MTSYTSVYEEALGLYYDTVKKKNKKKYFSFLMAMMQIWDSEYLAYVYLK